MDLKTAQQTGRKQAIKTTLFFLLVWELYWLFRETRGDFANGILFFIAGQLNIYFISIIIFIFGVMYLLGRNVGKEIIIDGRNYLWVSIKYSLLSGVLVIAFVIGIFALNQKLSFLWEGILKGMPGIWGLVLITWIWSGRRIKSKIK